jgi:cation transport regulator
MSKSRREQKKKTRSTTTNRSRQIKSEDKKISARTKKQIDSLPEHAQHIYKKAHASATEQYQNPQKRRGGKRQSAEEVAHKTAWAAVKKEYKKKGNEWVRKEE